MLRSSLELKSGWKTVKQARGSGQTEVGTPEVPGSAAAEHLERPTPPGPGDLATRGALIPPQVRASRQEGSAMEALSSSGLHHQK